MTPIDIPETVPNPAHTPAPAPAPERAPTKVPDKVPEKVIAPASFGRYVYSISGSEWDNARNDRQAQQNQDARKLRDSNTSF